MNIGGHIVPENLLYSDNHVWAKVRNDTLILGVTDFLQKLLGTIISVHLPGNSRLITRGDSIVWLESVRAIVAVLSPINCELIEINEKLMEKPHIINMEPYDRGWIAVVKVLNKNDMRAFKSAEAYVKTILALSQCGRCQVS
ncbi:MAG: glycine cleavage system protein H [Candidatus Nezhaarchaeales archaeon]